MHSFLFYAQTNREICHLLTSRLNLQLITFPTFTSGNINTCSQGLVNARHSDGVGPGDRVGLLL